LPWSEVKAAKVSGTGSIPLLTDLLEAFPDARFNIDAKTDEAVAPLVSIILSTGTVDRVCIGAFSDRRLAIVRTALGRKLCTTVGPKVVMALRAASWRAPGIRKRLARQGGACVQVPPRWGSLPLVDRRFVDAAHQAGLPVHVWTIDNPASMEALLDLGVDGIMTDRPAVLKEVLQGRGAWKP
jgi:glycerophosphoryl diester phosphodiesterase